MIKALILAVSVLLLPRVDPATLAAARQTAPALPDPTTMLYYTHPADKWENALRVGNGWFGATLFGCDLVDVCCRGPGVTLQPMTATGREDFVFEPDPTIEAYKRDVDRTLLRERLARTPAERADDLVELAKFAEELRAAGARRRA
jgi:hypothetical protein